MEFEDLKTLFQRFNRKERYHLIHYACNGFGVSPHFRSEIEKALRINLDEKRLWMAMDYHLDWLSAIVTILKSRSSDVGNVPDWLEALHGTDFKNHIEHRNYRKTKVLEGTQQDLDLLLLAQDAHDDGTVHLIMVEAKMDSSWGNNQIDTKAKRMNEVFPKSGSLPLNSDASINIELHFIFMDKNSDLTKNLKTEVLPDWAFKNEKAPHIQLPLATGAAGWPLFKPVRKNKKQGVEEYENWQIERVRGPADES